MKKGLTQGNPLSPFVFVMVGETLNRMIEAADSTNLASGFKPARDLSPINHLQSANGTLIFCGAEEEQILNINAIFFMHELIGVGTSDGRLWVLAEVMGCQVGSLPAAAFGY